MSEDPAAGCTCGIPSRAAYYVNLVIGRDVPGGTETSYVDWYACGEHVDEEHPEAMLDPQTAADGWYVLQASVQKTNNQGRRNR